MEQFLQQVASGSAARVEMTKHGKRAFYSVSELRDRYDPKMTLATFTAAVRQCVPADAPKGSGAVALHGTKKEISFAIAGERRDTCFSCTRSMPPVTSGPVTSYFGDIKKHLLQHIAASESVVGCVAWLTERSLRRALAEKGARIVVNNDRYNRPLGDREGLLEIIRLPSAKSKALMHNKFLVFLDASGRPYAVWTGSFNFSGNASRSLENAVYIDDAAIAQAYHQAWSSVCSYAL